MTHCQECLKFGNWTHKQLTNFTTITSPWPFALWGIDLIGLIPTDKGGVKYALVVIDYFINWTETEPLATITEAKITSFV